MDIVDRIELAMRRNIHCGATGVVGFEEAARCIVEAMLEMQPVVRASDNSVVHELRGAPRDLWLILMTAAVMRTSPATPSSE
jgi:hypothetical protein